MNAEYKSTERDTASPQPIRLVSEGARRVLPFCRLLRPRHDHAADDRRLGWTPFYVDIDAEG